MMGVTCDMTSQFMTGGKHAYLQTGRNANPSAANITKLLGTVRIEADSDEGYDILKFDLRSIALLGLRWILIILRSSCLR